jgi:hypothetical protein
MLRLCTDLVAALVFEIHERECSKRDLPLRGGNVPNIDLSWTLRWTERDARWLRFSVRSSFNIKNQGCIMKVEG